MRGATLASLSAARLATAGFPDSLTTQAFHCGRRGNNVAIHRITPSIAIDSSELHWRFVRASGPGGQNVNKVATAVHLRFDVTHSPSLPGKVKSRLLALAGNRATDSGEIVINAQRFRTQHQNRDDARARLIKLIHRATIEPKQRRKTKPSRAQRQRRLDNKRRRSGVKRLRRVSPSGD